MNSDYRAVRLHILGCRAIAAAIEERIERARLAIASDLLAAESHARDERVLETMRDAPRARHGDRRPADRRRYGPVVRRRGARAAQRPSCRLNDVRLYARSNTSLV